MKPCLVALLTLILLLAACEGDPGPTGPPGTGTLVASYTMSWGLDCPADPILYCDPSPVPEHDLVILLDLGLEAGESIRVTGFVWAAILGRWGWVELPLLVNRDDGHEDNAAVFGSPDEVELLNLRGMDVFVIVDVLTLPTP